MDNTIVNKSLSSIEQISSDTMAHCGGVVGSGILERSKSISEKEWQWTE